MYLNSLLKQRIRSLANGHMANPVYEAGKGPINVKVYDPVKVPAADFELVILDTSANPKAFLKVIESYWVLQNLTTGEEYYSDKTIAVENEQLIPGIGFICYQLVKNQIPEHTMEQRIMDFWREQKHIMTRENSGLPG